MSGAVEGVALQMARQFHEAYERLAPSFGYETRPETREFDPSSANGRLMVAVCEALTTPPARSYADEDVARIIDPGAWQERERLLVCKAKWESRPASVGAAYVRVIARNADEQVAPSLAKAAAIRVKICETNEDLS